MRDKQVATFLQGWSGFVRGVISSEKPNNTKRLSDILETGDVPQRFFLSATACRGILRRAAKRGKSLPSALHEALLNASTQKPKP